MCFVLYIEAFINIFTKIDQFDNIKGEFKSWSARIAINTCLRHSKRMNSRKEIELSSTEYQIPISPDIISRLTNAEVLKVLSRMPIEYFQVFNLFIVDGSLFLGTYGLPFDSPLLCSPAPFCWVP